MTNEKPRLIKVVPIVPNNSWKFEFVGLELVVESGEFIKHFISLYPLQSSPLAYNCKWNTFLFIWIPTVSSCSQLFFSFGRPGHIFFAQSPKLYIPSTLNIELILWHTQLIVCAIKCWNHGFFLSLFKLIHWILCVLAYLNLIFEF